MLIIDKNTLELWNGRMGTRPTQTITVFDPFTHEEITCYGQQTPDGLMFYSEDGSAVFNISYHAIKCKITAQDPSGQICEARVKGIDTESVLDSGIHKLDISKKTANRISSSLQLGKVRDVLQFTRAELLKKPGIGIKSVDELEAALERKNLKLITDTCKPKFRPKFLLTEREIPQWLKYGIQTA